MDEFEQVMAAGTNAQRKDLLHRVVKKVLIRDRHTVEVWYALPNRGAIESWNNWLPERPSIRKFECCDRKTPKRTRFRTRQEGPPEVWFRILHIAPDGNNIFAEADLIEQTVEIALGSKEAFENGNVSTLKRRVTADRIVNAAAKARRPAKHVRERRPPHVIELLQRAQEWHRQLEAGEVRTQAEIAQREGITRARVTQVMGLLRLAREIQKHILSLPDMVHRPAITERALRPIAQMGSAADQKARFEELIGQAR